MCLFVNLSKLVVICCAVLSSLVVPVASAFGATAPPNCPTSPVAFAQNLFQQPIDATHQFELRIVAMKSPDNNNVALLYQAVYKGKVVAYNPTLVARVGDTIDFTLQDCLTKKDIANLQQFLPRQVADTPAPTLPEWFQVDQAEQVTPMGYSNFHSHGLAGAPTRATPGQPDIAAEDEVVGTFVATVAAPSLDPTVSTFQNYKIKVPAQDGDLSAQDDGLYWYHPHFHGESQQAVFLGLTGAIVVLPKSSLPIDPKAAGTVLVIRDRPISDTPFNQPVGRAGRRPLVHTRELFLKSMGAPRAMGAAPKKAAVSQVSHAMAGQPSGPGPAAAQADPACRLFDVPNGSNLCLPDHVTPTGNVSPPQLTTLVTVNGTRTETPDTNDPNTVTHLTFKAIGVQPAYPLRVLNASANTYLKLSLVAGEAPGGVDTANPNTTVQALPLTVFRRDGHKPPAGASFSDGTILLPPGSRVEFQPTSSQSGTVSLVSRYVNTGPAGDLVPYRLLAKISPEAPGAATATAHVQAMALPGTQGDGPTRYKEAFANRLSGTAGQVHRAFALFEQNRACTPDGACGTSFYLIDITASKYGLDGHPKSPVTEAKPFMMPMKNGAMDMDRKDLFNGPGGRFNAAIPAVQVALHGQEQVNEIWEIYNFTAEYHAFHIHQLGFGVQQSCAPLILVKNSQNADCDAVAGNLSDENQEANLLLDVINVPYAMSVVDGAKTTIYPGKVTLDVPFTNRIVGDFVLHCHLLEHEDNGMMLGIQVWKDEIPK
jgi:FtsP/CotA-like multicopper oxidase with cupredoxin domain